MRRWLLLVGAVTAALVALDPRAATLSVVVAVVALLVPAARPARGRMPVPAVADVVAVALGCLLVTVTLASVGGAPTAAVATLLLATVVVVMTLVVVWQPAGDRAISATGGATVGSLPVVLVVALRGEVPATTAGFASLLAAGGLVAAAWVCWSRWRSQIADERAALLAAALAVAALAPLLAVSLPGSEWGGRLGVAAVAVGLLTLAATVGHLGSRMARAPRSGAKRRGGEPGALRLVAVAALGSPVLLVALAVAAGVLPATTTIAAVLPTVPAALHLGVVARRRRDRAEAASRDALTGLATEPVFAELLAHGLARARRDGARLGVAFLDLDGFKAVNDRHGHDAGDALLAEVARRLTLTVREGDVVARRSGDEFLVLLPDVTERVDVEQVAMRVADAIAEPIVVGDAKLEVEASVGLALWPDDAPTAGELLTAADAAMYDAKAAGPGDAVRWCSAAATARSQVAGRLRRELEAAVAAGDIAVGTEPVIRLGDGVAVATHVEARWEHPRLGRLSVATYLPLLVDPVVARCYDDAVLMAALAAPSDPTLPLVVPCTAASLHDPDWPTRLARRLAEDGRSAGSVQIAVTAGAVRRGGHRLLRAANRLEDLGVGVVVTDLGDGQDLALRDLATLPLAGIELAAPLVAAHRRRTDRAVMAALAAVAHRWGIPLRAAGVDGAACVARLREIGVTAVRVTGADVLLDTSAADDADGPPARREDLAARGRDLDAVARALLEGRVEVSGTEVDEVLARVLADEAAVAA